MKSMGLVFRTQLDIGGIKLVPQATKHEARRQRRRRKAAEEEAAKNKTA